MLVQEQSADNESEPKLSGPPSGPQRWQFGLPLRVAWVCWIVGFGGFSIAMIVTGLGTGFGGAVVADVVMALGGWRWIFVPYLEIDDKGVTIQNAFRHHRFAWSRLKHVYLGKWGIWFELDDGKEICASAVEKSPAALRFGWRTRSDRVAATVQRYGANVGVNVDVSQPAYRGY